MKKYNKYNLEIGTYYLIKEGPNHSATTNQPQCVITITTNKYGYYFSGDAIYGVREDGAIVSFNINRVVKKITKEDNPEYFL